MQLSNDKQQHKLTLNASCSIAQCTCISITRRITLKLISHQIPATHTSTAMYTVLVINLVCEKMWDNMLNIFYDQLNTSSADIFILWNCTSHDNYQYHMQHYATVACFLQSQSEITNWNISQKVPSTIEQFLYQPKWRSGQTKVKDYSTNC